MKPAAHFLIAALASCSVASAHAASISVNLRIGSSDNNSVDSGETATVENPAGVTVDGAFWNNLTTANTSNTSASVLAAASTGGSAITLTDDDGNNAADLTTTLAANGGFTIFADVSPNPARGIFGDAGMFQSLLNFGGSAPGETLVVSNLSGDFTANGYSVVLYYDIGSVGRTYGHTVSDGLVSATFWTNDTAGVDSDSNGDGVMEYVLATGTTSGTATSDASYAVFTGLTADGFTVSAVERHCRAFRSSRYPSLPRSHCLGLVVCACYGVAVTDSISSSIGTASRKRSSAFP